MVRLNYILSFIFISLFLISFISATQYEDCSIYGNCPAEQMVITFNNDTGNVNNSIYWQGHTGTDGSWLTGISTYNSTYNGIINNNSYLSTFNYSYSYLNTSQWLVSGNNIYNKNSGKVGIGTTAPSTKLDVNGNVSLNNTLYVTGAGKVGIGTITPAYLLTVGNETGTNSSSISIYAYGNISAAGYITRTEVYDKSQGSALDKILDANSYKNLDGSINHSAFSYSAVSYDKSVFDRMITSTETKEVCSTEIIKEATEELPAETKEVCNNIEVNIETPTYKTIQEEGVSLDKEVALLKQAIYELKDITTNLINRITGAENRITALEIENQRIKDCAKEIDYKSYQECVNK